MVKEHSIRMKQRRKDNPELMKKQGARIKERKEKFPELRKRKMKRRYGLSYEDWLKMYETQEGKCLICGNSFGKPSKICIDHDHETGEVRGLLCSNCNSGLSFFKDNPKIMTKAIEYLL